MLNNSVNGKIHRVIGDEMDFMSLLSEILNPPFGMHAAAVGDETEDHGVMTPGGSKSEYGSISSLYEILSFFIICF